MDDAWMPQDEPDCITLLDLIYDLGGMPAPSFLVEHLIPKRQLVLLSGPSSAGKTALAIHIVVAVLSARPVADQFDVPRLVRQVLVVNAEMNPAELIQYATRSTEGLGLNREPFFDSDGTLDRILTLGTGRDTLRGANGQIDVSRLRRVLAEHPDVELVVIDSFRAAFVVDENSANEIVEAYGELRKLIDEFGVSMLILHHLRKSQGGYSGNRGDRVAGSGYIVGGVDTHIQIDPGPKGFMRRMSLQKTRTPSKGVYAGTEWGIEGTLTDTSSSFRIITTAAPKRDPALDKLMAHYRTVGNAPQTTDELNTVVKRAAREKFTKAGILVEVPRTKGSRTKLWALSPGVQHPVGNGGRDLNPRRRPRFEPLSA